MVYLFHIDISLINIKRVLQHIVAVRACEANGERVVPGGKEVQGQVVKGREGPLAFSVLDL